MSEFCQYVSVQTKLRCGAEKQFHGVLSDHTFVGPNDAWKGQPPDVIELETELHKYVSGDDIVLSKRDFLKTVLTRIADDIGEMHVVDLQELWGEK